PQTQRHILAERLRALIDGHMDGAVIIEAEAGMGKSRLVMDLLEQAATQAVQTLIGAADAVEQSTPYYAWRAVFNRALGLDGTHDPSGRRARVLALLEHDARLAQWAPLLSEFLQLDLPDNETTAQMTGPARADNLQKLLADVLALAVRSDARSRPLLLIIEDGHWLDSSSWALIPMVMRQIQPMLIVVATRPLADPIPPEYWRLIAQENSDHLQLEALPVTDIEVLVCRRLGVTGLPQAVADFIREQAEGHPFFSEELAFALRDTGILRVTDSECRLAPGVSDLRALDFPTTIEGVITSRIDSLPPQSQLAVKVASIIGRAFPYHILEDIYPVDLDRPRLPDHLEAAARLDIVRQDTPEPQLAYLFKHIITQEVAYSLLLFTQRQQLHRAVAEWYERAHANDLSPYYSLLAYHWSKAAEDETASIAVAHKAIDYLDAAGEQALRNSAYREAIRFFEQAFKLESQVLDRADRATGESAAGRLTPDRVRRQAHRHLRLGEAYRSWGYLSEARKAFERTAALYGYPTPTAKRQMIGGLIGQAAKQVLHRLRPARYVGRAPEAARPMLLETSTSYQYAAEVYYFANEVSLSLYTTLLSLNLSERVGDSRELVNAYAVMGIITGAMGKRNWAEAYFRLAEDTARRLNSTLALGRLCSSRGLYYLEAAQWDQADENLSRSMAILEEIGDKRYWGDSALMLAAQASFIGEFDRAIDLYEAMTGPRSGSLIHRTSSAVWQGRVKILQGRLEEAIHLLNRGLELSADAHDPVTVVHMKISAWSFLAGAYLRQGDLPAARQAADAASQIVAETRASARQLSLAFDYLAEVYIALWASESSPGDRKRFEDAAQRISRALLATQRPGQTRAWRCRGLYEWQAGRPAQAHRAWQKSLSIASGLRMPYEQAQAHYEIGRHLPTTDPARREHLRHAREIFARIGAAYDLALTEKALEQH
ncbi:MAG TPA: AAA family ATPase, partial [Anaerolineae bacterium]